LKKLKKTKLFKVVIFSVGIVFIFFLGINIVPRFMVGTVIDVTGEPVEIQEGIYALPGVADYMTEQEIQEFADEYGEDEMVIIYEVGN